METKMKMKMKLAADLQSTFEFQGLSIVVVDGFVSQQRVYVWARDDISTRACRYRQAQPLN